MKGKGRKGGRVGVVWGKEKGGGEGMREKGGTDQLDPSQ